MKKVYVLNGAGGVGKDTFVSLVSKHTSCGVAHESIIDKTKEIARVCGWSGAKEERDRKFLSDLKDLLTEYSDLPFRDIVGKVQKFKEKSSDFYGVCFIDIRDCNDVERAVKEFGAKAILVTNPNVPAINSNHADADVYDYQYDLYVENSGTLEDLEQAAIKFCIDEGLPMCEVDSDE